MDSALSNAKRAISEDIKLAGDGRPADYLVPVFQIIITDVKNMLEHHPGAYQAASMYSTKMFGFVREARQKIAKSPPSERLSVMLDLGAEVIKGLIQSIMDAVRRTPFAPSQPTPAMHGPPPHAYPPPTYSYQSSYAYPSAPPMFIPQQYGQPSQSYAPPPQTHTHTHNRQPSKDICRNFLSARGCTRRDCKFAHDVNAQAQGYPPRAPQQPK